LTIYRAFFSLSRKAGEGWGKGQYDRTLALYPLTLSLSHKGRGDPRGGG